MNLKQNLNLPNHLSSFSGETQFYDLLKKQILTVTEIFYKVFRKLGEKNLPVSVETYVIYSFLQPSVKKKTF